jgi:hypothetical protein
MELVKQHGSLIALLLMPFFVDQTSNALRCASQDALIVVPLSVNTNYATKSSSAAGCYNLGNVAKASDTSESGWIPSTPYQIKQRGRIIHMMLC